MSKTTHNLFIADGCPDLFYGFRNVDRIPASLTDGTVGYVVPSLSTKELEGLSEILIGMVNKYQLRIDLTGDWSARIHGTDIHLPVIMVNKSEKGGNV